MMNKIIFLFLLLSGWVLHAQNFETSKLDALFQELAEKDQFMGSLAIYQDGKKAYAKAVGFKDLEIRSLANTHTQYRIGSISKTYTASLIMLLVEEGKIQLSDKLSDFFPDLPNAGKIDILQLLSHQSGLANLTDRTDYLTWNQEEKSQSELLALIKAGGTDFEPGARNEYSNTNYILLSFIAEALEGKKFGKLLEKRIFQALDLKGTQLGGKIRIKNNEALSYTFDGNHWKLEPETNMSIPRGAGAVVASASNVAEFYNALFTGKILSPTSLETMKESHPDYGLGLFSLSFKDKKGFGHTGGIDGFQSIAIYFPEEKTSVALLSNGLQTELKEVLDGALSIYYGYAYDLPTFEPIVHPERYTGTYRGGDFPLDLEIHANKYALYGQATGQPSFKLKQIDETHFAYAPADLKIEFSPESNTLKLTQYGNSFTLTRKVLKKVAHPEYYIGVYTAPGFPMDLRIFTKDDLLYGQATGQPEFRLSEMEEDQFEFKPANLTIHFFPKEESLEFTQNGRSFKLEKKK